MAILTSGASSTYHQVRHALRLLSFANDVFCVQTRFSFIPCLDALTTSLRPSQFRSLHPWGI